MLILVFEQIVKPPQSTFVIDTIFPIFEYCAPPSILWHRKSKKEDVSSIISLNSRNTQPRYQS